MAASDADCPRCGQVFRCGAHDDQPCWCNSLTLGPDLLAALRERHDSCLCQTCLLALSRADTPRAEP